MPVLKEEKEFVTYVVELMQSIGPVNAKRMFVRRKGSNPLLTLM